VFLIFFQLVSAAVIHVLCLTTVPGNFSFLRIQLSGIKEFFSCLASTNLDTVKKIRKHYFWENVVDAGTCVAFTVKATNVSLLCNKITPIKYFFSLFLSISLSIILNEQHWPGIFIPGSFALLEKSWRETTTRRYQYKDCCLKEMNFDKPQVVKKRTQSVKMLVVINDFLFIIHVFIYLQSNPQPQTFTYLIFYNQLVVIKTKTLAIWITC